MKKITSIIFLFLTLSLQAQKRRSMLKDTLDGKLDLSSFILDAHGFLPALFIITEPALGGFGAAATPVWIKPKKDLPPGQRYAAPDITAGMAMYTANGSWAAGGGKMGSIPRAGIKYRVFGGYGNANINFYRDVAGVEKAFAFNISTIPVLGSVSKQVTQGGIYIGLQYAFAHSTLSPRFSGDADFIKPVEFKSNVSALGVFVDVDRRDGIFTPDKGGKLDLSFNMNDNWTGSDYQFQKLGLFATGFLSLKENWVSGVRIETQNVFNEPPFYLLPSVNLRGVPLGRFQGRSLLVVETEQRFDLNLRWSAVGFAGYGRTFSREDPFIKSSNVYNLGTGFRYLVARQFKLRAGIDVAKGPDSWGWYIIFGHNWNR